MLRAFGNATMFGEPAGDGPIRVVFLHGWRRAASDFSGAAALLASRGVASLALDLPGFGSSPVPSAPGGARHYAALVAPVLREVSDHPVVLVGHSFGGRVATCLAADYPVLVSGLVLTGVPLVRRRDVQRRSPRTYRAIRWAHGRGWFSDERMERARQRYGSDDYRHATGVMRDVLVIAVNESYEDELSRLTQPIRFVWGARETEVPVAVAEDARALVTHAPSTLEVVADVGHFVPTQRPDTLATAVFDLLGVQ